jgi:hypothetical protein
MLITYTYCKPLCAYDETTVANDHGNGRPALNIHHVSGA